MTVHQVASDRFITSIFYAPRSSRIAAWLAMRLYVASERIAGPRLTIPYDRSTWPVLARLVATLGDRSDDLDRRILDRAHRRRMAKR